MRTIAFSVLVLVVSWGAATADELQRPANGHWAQFVVDKLDLRSFPSSLGNRRNEGKITFSDFGIIPRSLSAEKAVLGTDWEYTIIVLNHDRHDILVCFIDRAANGGSYYAQALLKLTPSEDGKRLLGTEVSAPDKACPQFAR